MPRRFSPLMPVLLAIAAGITVSALVRSSWMRSPKSIDLILFTEHGEQPLGTIKNTRPVLSLLRSGNPVPNHNCPAAGKLVLRFNDGAVEEVIIQPGHTNSSYELQRHGELLAVPRGAFMSALAVGGIATNKIPTE